MILAAPLKRASKFSMAYGLYLAIVWMFDYVYYPWLAIKFRHLMFFALYPSIFLVSWGGFYLYAYFQEDVFFTEKVHAWLEQSGSQGIRRRFRSLIANNPRCVFVAVATWWSPLHAYVFFRRDKTFSLSSLVKALAKGSFICALFWGIVAESFIILWGLFRLILSSRHHLI
jgi:hypothetical protein